MKRALFLCLALAAGLVSPTPARADQSQQPFTVVAVVDSGFSPYHFDFLGHQHPFNRDADPANDVDFSAHPSTYLSGYPSGSEPIDISIPFHPQQKVDRLRHGLDAPAWASFEHSSPEDVNLHWFPGTKIVGAVNFSGEFYGGNEAHGTRSAASAAGNHLGTCPECLFVLVKGSAGLAWAASQPWIDVVTNSYGHGTYSKYDPARAVPRSPVPGGAIRDNVWFDAPLAATKAASEEGRSVVFSAGNGVANAFIAPTITHTSSEKGPDWIVTVGAVSSGGKQTASGHGKPVDVSSVGIGYPSTGSFTANGRGTHSGTSNAAPVIAGYIGAVIQAGRDAFGDVTEGASAGIVADGQPMPCAAGITGCVLGDGRLTMLEVQDIVMRAARPSATAADAPLFPTIPTVEGASYVYQGRGVLVGRMDGDEVYAGERGHMSDVLHGRVAPHDRPAGEDAWFVADSKCRQRLWGRWSGGAWQGTDPGYDPSTDAPAILLDAACEAVPQDLFANTPQP